MNLIQKYFPNLSEDQNQKIDQMKDVYEYWNQRINVVSRKDIEQIYLNHVLHSLAIAKLITFKPGTKVLDIGTGGGFPGIPLAILFPEVQFHLVDSIGKKITVVEEVSKSLGLTNVVAEKNRAEDLNVKVDFVLSRAVAQVRELVQWTTKLIQKGGTNDFQNGWILLKGGDLKDEIRDSGKSADVIEISNWFTEDFFMTKKIVYITA